jgi:tetratricopeptide (TPR) repeat protein
MRRPFVLLLAATFVFWAGVQTCAPREARAQSVHADTNDPLAGDSFASDPQGAIERARRGVAKGDLAGAISALARYVAAHPREVDPARYLGDLSYRAGDIATAERTYLRVLTFAPSDAQTHDRLGGMYAAQDRVAEAIAQFERSLPETSAYAHLVDLHRRLGDLAVFERAVRVAADDDSMNAAAQYALGTIYVAEHRPAEAVPYLEHALLLDGSSCPTLAELGTAYADLARYGDAEKTLQRCLAYEADNYAASVNLGTVFVELGRLPEARSAFDRASRVRPDGPEALVDIGYVEDEASHWDVAVGYYLRAIAADPLARDAYVNLGYDYGEHHLFSLAEAAYLKGLSVSPGDGRLHYLLGVAYAVQGKRELALAQYRAATTSDEPEVAAAASRDLSALQ